MSVMSDSRVVMRNSVSVINDTKTVMSDIPRTSKEPRGFDYVAF